MHHYTALQNIWQISDPQWTMAELSSAILYSTTVLQYYCFLWPLYRIICINCNPVKNWRILLKQSFTAYMAFMTATSTFRNIEQMQEFSMVLP